MYLSMKTAANDKKNLWWNKVIFTTHIFVLTHIFNLYIDVVVAIKEFSRKKEKNIWWLDGTYFYDNMQQHKKNFSSI